MARRSYAKSIYKKEDRLKNYHEIIHKILSHIRSMAKSTISYVCIEYLDVNLMLVQLGINMGQGMDRGLGFKKSLSKSDPTLKWALTFLAHMQPEL